MIVNELESIKEEISIKEELTRSITSFVNGLPEGIQEYTLYQLDTDLIGLFIKFYLLSINAEELNTNLEDLMHMWDITEEQLVKYEQELIEEGLLDQAWKNGMIFTR